MKKLLLLICITTITAIACDPVANHPPFDGYSTDADGNKLCTNLHHGNPHNANVLGYADTSFPDESSMADWTCGCPSVFEAFNINRTYNNGKHLIKVDQRSCLGMETKGCNDNGDVADTLGEYGTDISLRGLYQLVDPDSDGAPPEAPGNQGSYYFRSLSCTEGVIDNSDGHVPNATDTIDVRNTPYCDAGISKYISSYDQSTLRFNANGVKAAVKSCLKRDGLDFEFEDYVVTNLPTSPGYEAENNRNAYAFAFGRGRASDPWPSVSSCIRFVLSHNFNEGRREDTDNDQVCDIVDNCRNTPNYEENFLTDEDSDNDGTQCDNCPNDFNPEQENSDGDAYGDACDKCPEDFGNNLDSDGDGTGDACDECPYDAGDPDEDGVCQRDDVCPEVNDPEQLNSDDDPLGDACDNCPEITNRDQRDSNANGIGDVCEDLDGDSVMDINDNCPPDPAIMSAAGIELQFNPDQMDNDNDGEGDACDLCPELNNALPDGDGDCIEDENDTCPETRNTEENNQDMDGDGYGDACDTCPDKPNLEQSIIDLDSDSIPDECDNCPNIPNADQRDLNGNGIGDQCEVTIAGFASITPYVNARLMRWGLTSFVAEYSSNLSLNEVARVDYSFTNAQNQLVDAAQAANIHPCNAAGGTCATIIWRGDANTQPGNYRLTAVARRPNGTIASTVQMAFTVYEITVEALTPGYQVIEDPNGTNARVINIYANNDNDTREADSEMIDWTINHDLPQNNALEDDLVGVRISVEPAMHPQTRFKLEHLGGYVYPNGDVNFILWQNAHKNSETLDAGLVQPPTTITQNFRQNHAAYLPLHNSFYVEGAPLGNTTDVNINLAFPGQDGNGDGDIDENEYFTVMTDENLTINVISLDLIRNKANVSSWSTLASLSTGLWDRAFSFDQQGSLSVLNDANPASNLVDLDANHFYVRLVNKALRGLDRLSQEIHTDLMPKLAVTSTNILGQETVIDAPTPIPLDALNDGIMVSKAQLLTTTSLTPYAQFVSDTATCEQTLTCNDDDYRVHNGFTGPASDEGFGDRTHQANIRSSIRLTYQGSPAMPPVTRSIPVCGRDPEDRKQLQVRFHVLGEPYVDTDGNGHFTFRDLNGNGRCDWPDTDGDGIQEDAEAECEPFYNLWDDDHHIGLVVANPQAQVNPGRVGLRGPVIDSDQIQRTLTLANTLWSQACIEIIPYETHPGDQGFIYKDAFHQGGLNNFDWSLEQGLNNIAMVDEALYSINREERFVPGVLDIYIVPGLIDQDGVGMAYSLNSLIEQTLRTDPGVDFLQGNFGNIMAAGNGVIFLSTAGLTEGTFAHELAHILENTVHTTGDSVDGIDMDNEPYREVYFYPSQGLGASPIDRVTSNRRLRPITIENSRILRDVIDFGGLGNTLLTPLVE